MGSIFGVGSSTQNNYSNLTSSILSAGSSGNALGDMALIRSGAYKKLMKAYYMGGSDKPASEGAASVDDSERKNLLVAKDGAANLKKSAQAVMDTEISEENRADLKEKLKTFINDYNSMLDSGSEVEDQTVLRNTLWLTQMTSKNGGLLSDMGISVGTDNKLSLDEEKFDKAQLTTMSTMFKGTDSFIGRVSAKADNISRIAAKIATDGTHASLYTKKGDFDLGSLNSILDKKG